MSTSTEPSFPLNITDMLNKMDDNAAIFMITFVTSVIIIIFGIYVYYMINLKDNKCSMIDALNPNKNTAMTTVVPNNNALNNYYIKSAYNCCSLGSYKNDYVGICALKNVLRQGVRGLDFEIFSIDNKPVIATSTTNNFSAKETFNYIDFEEALLFITRNAFNNLFVNNSGDPIIIHLRFKSENIKMYENLAAILSKYQSYFIDKQYNNVNLGSVSIQALMGKISILVNDYSKTYATCDALMEYVNMTSGSGNMRMQTFSDIKNGDSNQHVDLINFNKQFMTICVPDKETSQVNPDITFFKDTGCNMFALMYQFQDQNLTLNNTFFNNGAFVLKDPIFLGTAAPVTTIIVEPTLVPPPKYSTVLYVASDNKNQEESSDQDNMRNKNNNNNNNKGKGKNNKGRDDKNRNDRKIGGAGIINAPGLAPAPAPISRPGLDNQGPLNPFNRKPGDNKFTAKLANKLKKENPPQ
jgi:hypothetical protein